MRRISFVPVLLIIFVLCAAAMPFTGDPPGTVHSASQTMDVGIIISLIALAVSAVVIYILNKRRRRKV